MRKPEQVVAWSGAVQAQEYPAARWGLGVRLPEATTDADVERAFDDGRILRTHVLRPTWHFVTPADIGWMIALTGPHVHRRMAPYRRQLNIEDRMLARASRVFERALRDGGTLTRAELAARLGRAGLEATGIRLVHLLLHAELTGLICSGPRRNGQFTYALLAHRAPAASRLSDDEALAELTRRYVRSHGPATIRDFVWWSGLSTAQARRGLEIVRAMPQDVDGLTYWTLDSWQATSAKGSPVQLLPVYDEYLIAYRDRAAVPHGPGRMTGPQPVTFQHAIISNGQIAGTWRVQRRAAAVVIDAITLRPLSRLESRELKAAAERYGRFVGQPVVLNLRAGLR